MTGAKKEAGGEIEPALREESQETVGGVLALLAHDLRNPLAALLSNASFLSMVLKDLSADAREALEDVQLSVEALGRITDSLEVVSRDLALRPARATSPMTVAGAVGSVISEAERAAKSHGVRLLSELSAAKDVAFVASEPDFSRALSALLHNGISVAPPGTEVRFEVRSSDTEVLLELFDDGPKIPDALRRQAVSASGQAEIKTTRGARYSRGLGLYVARRSATLAGGQLEIPSADEECRLRLRFPRSVSSSE